LASSILARRKKFVCWLLGATGDADAAVFRLFNAIRHGELITGVALPAEDFAQHYTYLKLRDRLSSAFALVSVAVALQIGNGRITEAWIALGGVSHKPWRDRSAEQLLISETRAEGVFFRAA
jgi:xanthine dehydrogenase YagS FAD-binding subunit